MRLDGKVAFVTGGGGGLGLAIALELVAEGARVAIAEINGDLLKQAVAGNPGAALVPVLCDVSDRDAVMARIAEFAATRGGLDILVNNAVHFHYELLETFPADTAARMIDVGLKGTLWASQAAIPLMKARGGGVILNLSSVTVTSAFANTAVYTAVKGAIDALTRQQAAELGPHGIRVNALAPGSVSTPGSNSVIDEAGWRAREAKTLLGRLPSARDIGRAAAFLVSQDAACITGITLTVDSGMTIKGP